MTTHTLLITFYPIRSLPAVVGTSAHEAHVAPFIEQAAIESAATARRDDAKVFLREFTRELVKEINPSTKLITLAIVVILVGGSLYIGFSMFKELQRTRRLIDDQRAQLTTGAFCHTSSRPTSRSRSARRSITPAGRLAPPGWAPHLVHLGLPLGARMPDPAPHENPSGRAPWGRTRISTTRATP